MGFRMIDISFILSLIFIISGCSAPKDSNLNKNKKQSIKNQITLNERAYFVKWEEGENQHTKKMVFHIFKPQRLNRFRY